MKPSRDHREPPFKPRAWQTLAFQRWKESSRGVVSVVTGGGKTVFAQLCASDFMQHWPEGQVVVIVPTTALLDQWYVSFIEDAALPADEVATYSGDEKPAQPRRVNLVVLNTARTVAPKISALRPTFLIVDECHRVGSTVNAKALQGPHAATLGLSATPHREYDEGFAELVVPALGPVIYEYDYEQAYADKIISPFDLVNVKVRLLKDEQQEYDRLTRRIIIEQRRADVDEGADTRLARLLQQRAAVSSQAAMRIPVAAKIAESCAGQRTLLFHERVSAAEKLLYVLSERRKSVTIYHSRLAGPVRRDNLRLYRRGVFEILICCRALDEGMNVPETSVAIVAASTASTRQRIQRLGRVLRPAPGKKSATIFTLYATDAEERRLIREADAFSGITSVTWNRAR